MKLKRKIQYSSSYFNTRPLAKKYKQLFEGKVRSNDATLLTEKTSWYNIVLDIAGFIPGYGEIADAANALDYAVKGDFLFSALSLLSMIPELGDVLGKGGKVYIALSRLGVKGAKLKKVAKTGEGLKKGGEKITKLKKLIVKHKGLIKKLFSELEKRTGEDNKLKKYLPKMREALDAFLGGDLDTATDDTIEKAENEPEAGGSDSPSDTKPDTGKVDF